MYTGSGAITKAALHALIVVAFATQLSCEPSQKAEECTDFNAMAASHTLVKQKLKNPKSAEFPTLKHYRIAQEPEGIWRVAGYVDATNSFGATVRSDYVARLRCDGKRWFAVEVEISAR